MSRRYKHFTWLHGRLVEQFPCVSVAPLPDKQVAGRFEADFIEGRRRGLQRFLNRVANHPILGASSVFRHFLTVTDQKQWKSGKRAAEAEASSSTFLSSVQLDDDLPADYDAQLESCFGFSQWLDKQIHQLQKEVDDLTKADDTSASGYAKAAGTLGRFSGTSQDPKARPMYSAFWFDSEGPPVKVEEVLDGMAAVGAGLKEYSAMVEQQLDADQQAFYDGLQEYSGVLKTLPGLRKQHQSAWNDYKAAEAKGTLDVSMAL